MTSLEMALKAGFVQQHSGGDTPTNWYWAHPAEIERLVKVVQTEMKVMCLKACVGKDYATDCIEAIRAL